MGCELGGELNWSLTCRRQPCGRAAVWRLARRGGSPKAPTRASEASAHNVHAPATGMKLCLLLVTGPIVAGFGFLDPNADAQISLQRDARADLAYSPPHYPSPWMDPRATGWEDAYAKAKAFVSQMTLVEKVNLTTGTGYVG